MPTKTKTLKESLEVLIQNADDVSALAKSERDIADRQHENAHKLEKLSGALEVGAVAIKAELKKV